MAQNTLLGFPAHIPLTVVGTLPPYRQSLSQRFKRWLFLSAPKASPAGPRKGGQPPPAEACPFSDRNPLLSRKLPEIPGDLFKSFPLRSLTFLVYYMFVNVDYCLFPYGADRFPEKEASPVKYQKWHIGTAAEQDTALLKEAGYPSCWPPCWPPGHHTAEAAARGAGA